MSQLDCASVLVPERKVRGLLCLCFIAFEPATQSQTFNCGVAAAAAVVAAGVGKLLGRLVTLLPWAGSLGVRAGPDPLPRGWGWGMEGWGRANCHLFLLTLHTWGSWRCRHPSWKLPPPSPALHAAAPLVLYSSQRLSIRICWSIGLTRSISTPASDSLITSSLHARLFKDNWAREPASLWVTVGWNDNQLDPVQGESQQAMLDSRQTARFPIFKRLF